MKDGVFVTKTKGRRSIILVLSAIAVFCVSVAIVVLISIDSNAKEIQLEALSNQLQELRQDNQEMDYLINHADEAELYEHLARDSGYSYPDEKVFYDVTPGN